MCTIRKFKYIMIPLFTAIIFLYQNIIDKIGWRIAFLFNISALDKDDVFVAVSIHHIFMLVLSLIVITFLHRSKNFDFKIKPESDKTGVKYTIIYLIAVLIYYIFVYFISIMTNSIGTYDYELNAVNVIGTLGFQLFLSGPVEEIVFRTLPIVCFQSVYKKDDKAFDILVMFLTSMLFVYGHINFNVPLFSQLFTFLYVFINGMVYAFAFIRTKSVIYPMIMHSISNFISVGGCYLYMYLSNVA